MNEWPDELWASEQYLTRVTQDLYVNDADEETSDSLFTTVSTDRLAVIGASLILCSSVVMALLGVMVGSSLILIWQRHKAFGSGRVPTRG